MEILIKNLDANFICKLNTFIRNDFLVGTNFDTR